MAQNITIELTDAQWDLVVENGGVAFMLPNTVVDGVSTPVTITAEIISEELKNFLTARIMRRIQDKAKAAQKDAFDV